VIENSRAGTAMVDAVGRAGYRCLYWAARAFWFITRPRTSGAVVALWHRHCVLLMRTSYRPHYGFPGGFLKRGEPPADGAARELHEELGVWLPARQLVPVWRGELTFENRRDAITIFEASVDPAPAFAANGREVVWVGWRTPAEALSLQLLPHVRDYLLEAQRRGREST
jgi:8-oxo-dGTP diphosphatase